MPHVAPDAESIIELLRSVGCNGKLRWRGKHPQIVWWSHNGVERAYTISARPSDQRGRQNSYAAVRRILVDDGDLKRPSFNEYEEKAARLAERGLRSERRRIISKLHNMRRQHEAMRVEYEAQLSRLKRLDQQAAHEI